MRCSVEKVIIFKRPLNNLVKWYKRPLHWYLLLQIHHKLPNLDDKPFQKKDFIGKYFVIHRNIFTETPSTKHYYFGPILRLQKIQIYLFFRLWILLLVFGIYLNNDKPKSPNSKSKTLVLFFKLMTTLTFLALVKGFWGKILGLEIHSLLKGVVRLIHTICKICRFSNSSCKIQLPDHIDCNSSQLSILVLETF